MKILDDQEHRFAMLLYGMPDHFLQHDHEARVSFLES